MKDSLHTRQGSVHSLDSHEISGAQATPVALFQNQILTVSEVAKLLRVSSKTVYKKVRRDEIPHKKIGNKIRFLLPQVMDWLRGE